MVLKKKKSLSLFGRLFFFLSLGFCLGFLVGLNVEIGQKIGLARIIFELPKRLQVKLQPSYAPSLNKKNRLALSILEAKTMNQSLGPFTSDIENTLSISNHRIFCRPGDDLQQKVNDAIGKQLILLPGIHLSYVTDIPSNTTIYISQGAIIKLADDADLSLFGKTSVKGDAAVLRSNGTETAPLNNINIILNGIIDGNRINHPYSFGGFEGIAFKWTKNSSITGTGVVRNANGDGIDVDAVSQCYFEGIKLINNEGSGFHFGSPRPIRPSKRNVAVGLYAQGNGFERRRNGFDQSWVNQDVTFIGCSAKDNYRNWQIDGENGIVLACRSIDTGNVVEQDDFDDAFFAQVNGQVYAPSNFQAANAKASVYLDNRQTLSAQTWEKIEMKGESFDPGSHFDSVTDYDFTVPVSGYYFVVAAIRWDDEGVRDKVHNEGYCVAICVNEEAAINRYDSSASGGSAYQLIFTLIHLDENDRVDLWARSCEAGVDKDICKGEDATWMAIYLIE